MELKGFCGPKMETRYWRWALTALVCWTVFVLAMGCVFSSLVYLSLGDEPLPQSAGEWTGLSIFAVFLGLPLVALLVGPAWGGVVIARRRQEFGGAVLAIWGLLLTILIGGCLISAVSGRAFDNTTDMLYCGLCGFGALLTAALPLASGILLLVERRESRTSEHLQDSERELG